MGGEGNKNEETLRMPYSHHSTCSMLLCCASCFKEVNALCSIHTYQQSTCQSQHRRKYSFLSACIVIRQKSILLQIHYASIHVYQQQAYRVQYRVCQTQHRQKSRKLVSWFEFVGWKKIIANVRYFLHHSGTLCKSFVFASMSSPMLGNET